MRLNQQQKKSVSFSFVTYENRADNYNRIILSIADNFNFNNFSCQVLRLLFSLVIQGDYFLII